MCKYVQSPCVNICWKGSRNIHPANKCTSSRGLLTH